ncbi:CRISPR-associated helicase/endonuclease Cas3 [Clostridium subterminale]|uniref:CRISPR-associated helicase/endonuclease Cas3 n=1 Tax=Clostridium subterminale TaxID=1550 RepID=A0ABP3VV00_CLOSU
MYFNKDKRFKLEDYVNSSYKFYAHIKEKEGNLKKKETLEEHLTLAEENLYRIVREKKLKSIFINMEDKILGRDISYELRELFREMILNLVFIHDIGKINPCFQLKKMNNNLGLNEAVASNYSNHSMLSAIIYMDYYYKVIKKLDKENQKLFIPIMLMNSYIISKHHGNLDSFKAFSDRLIGVDGEGWKLIQDNFTIIEDIYLTEITITESKIRNSFKIYDIYINKINSEGKIINFIYEKLIFSLLLACDFYSTTEFMTGNSINSLGEMNDIDKFYDVYKDTEVMAWIRKYEKEELGKVTDFAQVKDINILRNEMFLEAERVLEGNFDSGIFYLEAPTGGGKSNISMNLSFKLIKENTNLNKIFYVYPFNTLVEQNINNINKTFGENSDLIQQVSVINSLVPIKKVYRNQDEEKVNYDESVLNRQFLHYPMVLTTHVSIFNYLFGAGKEDSFPLIHMTNSVIVLDEIQSYKNILWKEIIMFLKTYSELLNIKFIIMSATLPNLNKLVKTEENTVRLIKNSFRYFQSPVFKNRVDLDYSLLESVDIKEELYKKVKEISSSNNKKIVVEFISKKSAYDFYERLKEDFEILPETLLITGDDNSIDRELVLNKIKSRYSVILIATQVIEAGVDIDMDIGFKDISILDGDEQFLGRINRSCKKDGSKVYFFNLDKADTIYKGDVRKYEKYTLINDEMREILKNKEFSKFYDNILKEIIANTSQCNDGNIERFLNEKVGNLEFSEIEKRMKLIDDDKDEITLFLSRVIEDKDGTLIYGDELWYEYKALLRNEEMEFSEKKVKLSEVRAKLNYFIYKIRGAKGFTYGDKIGSKIGEIYFIGDGERFFKDDKFNKELFKMGIGDFI